MEEKKNKALEKVEKLEKRLNGETAEAIKDEEVLSEKRFETAKAKKEGDRERVKREKAELNRAVKEKRAQDKKVRKARRDAERSRKRAERDKDKGTKRGNGNWIAGTITLGIAVLALSTALAFNALSPNEYQSEMAGVNEETFYDTVSRIDNLDLDLSKFLVTSSSSARQKYLLDLAVNSEVAASDVSLLPIDEESSFYTAKLINQVGDYAKYLNGKLADGESLSKTDVEAVRALSIKIRELKQSLNAVKEDMGEDFDFSKISDEDGAFIKGISELKNLSVDYPELIYDGPFSDGQEDREIKGLKGEKTVSESDALKLFVEYFRDYGIDNAKVEGESNGTFKTYLLSGKTDDGFNLYASLTKDGGKLITFDYKNECNEVKYSYDDCVEIAMQLFDKLKIKNVRDVWMNEAEGVVTINFAGYENDTVIYPDLIKVEVCPETGRVVGMEASSYYMNHIDRNVSGAKISVSEAEREVSSDIDIITRRLAIIPVNSGKEVLAYEFMGTYNNETYYVYINAENGKQEELFKVVEGSEGTLLM